jgi:PAS domain S-box-containing protein
MTMKFRSIFFETNSRNILYSSLIFLASILLVTAVAVYVRKAEEKVADNQFHSTCSDVQTKVLDRLRAQAQLLRCGSALFASSDSVTRKDWEIFFRDSNIDHNLPGIQGFGFALIIPKNELQQHIKSIRKEGFNNYMVTPETDRDIYTSIIYIEPFEDRNLRAFGYDMFSEPIRRRAMEIARDSNLTSLSGKVKLVQETDKDVQAGVLMYVPVYRKGMPADTEEQRRAAIFGWVYSPYRMNDLMNGILGRWDQMEQGRIYLTIYDGDRISDETLLFRSSQNNISEIGNARIYDLPVDYHGTRWTLHFIQPESQVSFIENRVNIAIITGIIISFLVLLIYYLTLNTKHRAELIAEHLTAELKEGREQFRNLLNSAAEGIYGTDLKGNITFVNNSCLRILGYRSEDQLLGKSAHEMIHHSWPDGSHFDIRDCRLFRTLGAETGAHADDEFLCRIDGTFFPAEYWSHPIMIDGKNQGMVVTFFNITERKENEKLIKEASTRLSLAVRAGGVGIWDYDIVNNVLQWDDQMYALYGISRNSFGGAYESWINGLHQDDAERGNEEIQMAIRGEKDFNTEFRVIWPDSSVHYIRGMAVVQRDSSGDPVRMTGTNWEITEQKKTEDELNRAKLEAEIANSAKSEFLLNIGHEFRTPINAVIGYSELIESADGKARKEYAESIKSAGRRLLTMIDDILELIRMEKAEFGLEYDYTDTFKFFSDIRDSFSSDIAEKGLVFRSDLAEDLPAYICTDEKRLRQVINNLMDNAVKFTDKGEVSMKAYSVKSQSGKNDKRDLIIEVADTGRGIPEEYRKRMFEAFSQAESKTITNGLGIGLSITKNLVSKMNGNINVISQSGTGSRFILNIPDLSYKEGDRSENKPVEVKKLSSREINVDKNEISGLQELISELEGNLLDKCRSFEVRQPIGEVKTFGQELIALGQKHNCRLISEYGQEVVQAADHFNVEGILKLIKSYHENIEALK